jgi:hypothetical protein
MAVLLLVQLNSFCFIFKIPAVIEHYNHHKDEHKSDEGFFHYLISHLSNQAEHDQSHDEDHDSPFHNNHNGCCSVQFAAVYSQFTLKIKPLLSSFNKGINGYNQHFYHSGYLSFIWQPPRIS